MRRIILFGFITMLICGGTSCGEKTRKYDQAIASGDSALAVNNYEEAINYYEHAKSIKPGEEYPQQQIEKAGELQKSWEKQVKFNKNIQQGDNHFKNQDYQQAINAYYRALEANPHNKYALDQIEKAEAQIAEAEEQQEAMKNPYHIVVGSFEQKRYAEQLQQKLRADGYDSKLIPRYEGNTAVSLYSYPDLTTAWNNLERVYNMERFYDVEPWIVKHSLKQ